MTEHVLAKKIAQPRIALIGVALLTLFLLFQVFAPVVKAEPKLVSNTPTSNQYLAYDDKPVEVTLKFSEKLRSDASNFKVEKRDGTDKAVAINITPDATDPTVMKTVLAPAKTLGANVYIVTYTVTGADSGQVTAGTLSFYIAPLGRSFWELGYLFSTPDSAFTTDWNGYTYPPLANIFFLLAVVGTILGCGMFFWGRYRFFSNNRLQFTVVGRASKYVALASAIGLAFFLCRIGNLQPLNARILLYGVAVYFVVQTIRGIGWMLRSYPKAKAEWSAIQERNRPRKAEKAAAPVVKVPATSQASADGGDEGDEDRQEAIREALNEGQRGTSTRGDKRRAKKRK